MGEVHVMFPKDSDAVRVRVEQAAQAHDLSLVIVGESLAREEQNALCVCYQQIAAGVRKNILCVSRPSEILLAVSHVPGLVPVVVSHEDGRAIKAPFNCFIVEKEESPTFYECLLQKVSALKTASYGTLERYVAREWVRQQWSVDCIASESLASAEVCRLQGSILTNKYAEGYPGARYYGGCSVVDQIEECAQKRATTLFGCRYANVQPHSGSQANQAVMAGLINPGDTILGMELSHGGHLTHGTKVNMSGQLYKGVAYHVRKDTYLIDYEEVEKLALLHRPALIIAGASAYARKIDYERFRAIADKAGAYLLVDMAHVAGLIAGKVLPSPIPHAHIITSTNHKTMRGPRGGFILCNDEDVFKKINKGVFPRVQGGQLMHVIAAKAQAFQEASTMHYQRLMERVVKGAKIMAQVFMREGFDVLTGGTDNHKILIDLRSRGTTGKKVEDVLSGYNIIVNKNMVPFDTAPPANPSGVRLGSVALACRGFCEKDFEEIAYVMTEIILSCGKKPVTAMRKHVRTLCERHPVMH